MGINAMLNNSKERSMKMAIESSGLEPWNGSYGNPWGLEYLDFSWQFKPHWAVGRGFMHELDGLGHYSYYSSYSETAKNLDYSYWVDLTDFRFYAEYLLNPVDRFFTTRSKLLFGAGLEANLYQSLKLSGLEPPAGYDGEYYGFRDHSLNYSSLRLKLGAHLCF